VASANSLPERPTMQFSRISFRRRIPAGLCLAVVVASCTDPIFGQNPGTASAQTTVIEMEGTVQTARARTADWRAARTNESLAPLDRLRTREQSRAALRLRDRSLFRLGELSELTVEAPDDSQSTAVSMLRGVLMFFHRGRPKDIQFRTGTVSAAVRGTEFHVEVADNGRTVLTLFDGEVELSNPQGTLRLVSGEQAAVDPGQAPVKTAVLVTRNDLIQWCLYYPGVLDAAELNLTPAEEAALQSSLAAYRSGDLLHALALVPAGYQPGSDSARVYLAAVLLSAGKVDAALPLLDAIPPDTAENSDKPPAPRLAGALRRLILVVKNSPKLQKLESASRDPKCATLRLAESYQRQARADLASALTAAREATTISPAFAFAWARVAELEFSFGRRREAQAALARSLELAPRNAQAVALRGFLLAAEDRIAAAFAAFEEAIALAGALGNAWLGRGLCRIRRGELEAGREDLQVAALMEPQRSLFRSYLGKAWNELGEQRRAEDELRLAKINDPRDPTAYLYEALLLQQDNRINEAVTALERSKELNDNRRVYRSGLLLDQDQAVRGANLATIYRDAGMTDWSAHEASKAVNADYANYSAHLFLANSFNDLRDPQRVNLRYETPWLNEYLLANLLAPARAGTLSQQVSEQEYSALFDHDRIGIASSTEYFSHGDWRQSAAQYGTFGNSSFALEESYRSEHGYRPNSDLEETTYDLRFKHQITPMDRAYFQTSLAYSSGGNSAQYYDQSSATNDPFRFRERVEPVLVAGYHHEWSPGVHTLLLGSRLSDTYSVTNPLQNTFLLGREADMPAASIVPFATREDYRSELEIYSVEAQQIWQTPRQTAVLGTRYQDGGFDTESRQENFRTDLNDLFPDPIISDQNISTRFQRWSVYGYEQWQLMESLRLIGGLTYEHLTIPENHRFAPLSTKTETTSYLLPKAGAIWTPLQDTTFRAGYSESLSGASFDQSFRLEPSQVAGFNQAFRSLIPESVVGANAGARFTTYGMSLEQKFPTRTYVTVAGEWLESTVKRKLGAFEFVDGYGPFITTLAERLDFLEKSFSISLHQLVGTEWAFGGTYRLSRAELEDNYTEISDEVATASSFPARQFQTGTLQTLSLHGIYQHASGFFSQLRGTWMKQENGGYEPPRPGESFWQFDLMGGYRFPSRRAEIAIGVLNFTDQDYRLSPLNLHLESPRAATFVAQFQFHF